MINKFTQKAQNALNSAQNHASLLGHTYIGTEHLLLALCEDPDSVSCAILEKSGVDFQKTHQMIVEDSGTGEESRVNPSDMTPKLKSLIEAAGTEVSKSPTLKIGTEHLLFSLISQRDSVAVRIIEGEGALISEIKSELNSYFNAVSVQKKEKENTEQGSQKPPASKSFCKDLTALAKLGKFDPLVGREAELERMISILSRRTKNNPCLIGEPGVGKSALVEGLASRIALGSVPDTLKGKRLLSLDVASMIAGSKYRGEFEERFKNLLSELSGNKDSILFIDEIHTIVGAGSAEGAVDAANIIKPSLARGEIRVIGATTIAEYRRYIEKDAALERRFQPITLTEPSENEAIEMLRGIREKYELHHKIKISDDAINAAVKLSVRYIPDRFLPDKAIDLIDEAASRMRLKISSESDEIETLQKRLAICREEKEEAISSSEFERAAELRDEEDMLGGQIAFLRLKSQRGRSDITPTLDAQAIADALTVWTKIPVGKLLEDEAKRLSSLEQILKKRVIGQDEAVEKVARAIRRGRSGVRSPSLPIGSFLFTGQTGVGKTELAKALAFALFDDERALIRFDMSEYTERHSVSKLIGSPPGYVGFEESPRLTGSVRTRPYCVLLFDEIEKAHPDVFDLLLPVLEEGRLTDSQGRTVSFKNAVIIMTSNLGAHLGEKPSTLGFSPPRENGEIKKFLNDALSQTFRPEFLNRIDEIIPFRSLEKSEIEQIAVIMLDDLAKRLGGLNIIFSYTKEALAEIARLGFDKEYGARALRRVISSSVEDPISDKIISGEIRASDTIVLTLKNNSLFIENR